ncbi:hypothetical protein [Pseudomonas sp. MWU13-3659]|uniref:hypothetical protein n=1 Tax=Pseudomonas sp. MWU13-3659 TaxID=2986964 RepID=UPI002075976C|nr:hypothetical protein [Pseudomonas sp. MWU13-3659]
MSNILKNYFVAFIDLLGFSNMVSHDCENPVSSQKYIDKLKSVHAQTKKLQGNLENLQLIQFSDSVVLALPFNKEKFHDFLSLVADYQYELLKNSILCRGGISYGMHHFEDDFLFSSGLIHAYNLEKDISVNPRIVISKDLIDLIYPQNGNENDLILKESDGSYFINYLHTRKYDEAWKGISSIVPDNLTNKPSIRGKHIWLINYYNHCFPTQKQREVALFQ